VSGGVEELKLKAGELAFGASLDDSVGGREIGDRRAARRGDADAAADLSDRPVVQESAEGVRRASCHRVAGDDVLADGVLVEGPDGAWRDDRDLARSDLVGVDDALHAAVVVDVGVGVDDGGDRLVTHVLAEQGQPLGGGLDAAGAVDDDQPVLSVDDGQAGDVVVPDLVEAGHDLEEPAAGDELGLPPQAGLDRGRRLRIFSDELLPGRVEDHVAVGTREWPRQRGDEPATGVLEIGAVLHGVPLERIAVGLRGGGGCVFACRHDLILPR
jgi:hypothetical protein